jgi:hypothetical protein
MGTVADGRLSILGYEDTESSLGSALAVDTAGRLVAVTHNLYEFTIDNAAT